MWYGPWINSLSLSLCASNNAAEKVEQIIKLNRINENLGEVSALIKWHPYFQAAQLAPRFQLPLSPLKCPKLQRFCCQFLFILNSWHSTVFILSFATCYSLDKIYVMFGSLIVVKQKKKKWVNKLNVYSVTETEISRFCWGMKKVLFCSFSLFGLLIFFQLTSFPFHFPSA